VLVVVGVLIFRPGGIVARSLRQHGIALQAARFGSARAAHSGYRFDWKWLFVDPDHAIAIASFGETALSGSVAMLR
jgi:hypothetical protein